MLTISGHACGQSRRVSFWAPCFQLIYDIIRSEAITKDVFGDAHGAGVGGNVLLKTFILMVKVMPTGGFLKLHPRQHLRKCWAYLSQKDLVACSSKPWSQPVLTVIHIVEDLAVHTLAVRRRGIYYADSTHTTVRCFARRETYYVFYRSAMATTANILC